MDSRMATLCMRLSSLLEDHWCPETTSETGLSWVPAENDTIPSCLCSVFFCLFFRRRLLLFPDCWSPVGIIKGEKCQWLKNSTMCWREKNCNTTQCGHWRWSGWVYLIVWYRETVSIWWHLIGSVGWRITHRKYFLEIRSEEMLDNDNEQLVYFPGDKLWILRYLC